MNKRKLYTVIGIAVFVILVGLFALSQYLTHRNPNQNAKYYQDKGIIHLGTEQQPDQTDDPYASGIVLNNTNNLYGQISDNQFQYLKGAIGEYVHAKVDKNASSATVVDGKLNLGSGADFSFLLSVEGSGSQLLVSVHPIDFNTITVTINGQKYTPQAQGDD